MSVRIDDVVCTHATEKAILVEIDGDDHWIPQSQIDEDSEVWRKGDEGTLIISDWIAQQRALV